MKCVTFQYENNIYAIPYKSPKKKVDTQIVVSDSIIPNVNSTNFLGLSLYSKLSWKAHSMELTIKLNKACYAIRAMNHSCL
jgi:hypothetical protein